MLQFELPLFAGFGPNSKRKEAQLLLQSAIKNLEAEKTARATTISKAYYLLESNLKKLALLDESNREINRALILRRKGYEQGITSNKDRITQL